MIRSLLTIGMILGLAVTGYTDDEKKEETTEVKVQALTLNVPNSWESEQPKSRMRLAQFKIPAVEGDKEDAELLLFSFPGGGGGKLANVKRWIGQFDAEGREAKTVEGKSEQGEYLFVNISGTYNKSVGPPILQKTEPMKDARMLGVILNIEGKGVYYLKLSGPDKTVKKALQGFKKSFGADEKTEKEVKEDKEEEE